MSDLVAKCVLRVEVNETSQDADSRGAEALSNTDTNQKGRGQRKVRDISVETFPSRLESPREDWGLLPLCSRETTPSNDKDKEQNEEKGEIGYCIYCSVLSSRKEALTLCLLGVPTSMTCHDLLAFTAPCHADISHIRVLRDSLPNQYMALLTSLEPDGICRIVWVSNVEWAHNGLAPPGHTELPICPVCLERMDESVDGVLTILCNHAFHASCLEQWGDSTCPVCRYAFRARNKLKHQNVNGVARLHPHRMHFGFALFAAMSAVEVMPPPQIPPETTPTVYQGGHAASHYRESGHCYALQLGSHRVWDYKGDNFVHRLLQNKADGKLVPSEGPPSESEGAQEKVDAVQLEFTYLLTNDIATISEENKQLQSKLSTITKEKQTVERKLQQQNSKLTTTLSDLNEERQLGKALRNNQQQWQTKLTKLEEKFNELKESKEKEIADLKEQVRDLMFFIDAKQIIDKSDDREDIAGGTVTIGEIPKASTKRGRKKR
ncbi:hypothetical protein NQ314_013797 [Rhamnusium bicolor]|uniref:RING-type domain-containing protein n=1 Tax=Rhamnusium bicolor TaxID=1586634 RepID=A0AAV8X4Y0_9CUCU|nr:hypothetical protein NQ314_013797 [Rhamnusium bicolor]